MDSIKISHLNKAQVLAALYNASKPLGLGQFDPTPMSPQKAQAIIDELTAQARPLCFEYIRGRVMHVDLSGEEFDPRLYDRDNGQGAALKAVQALEHATQATCPKCKKTASVPKDAKPDDFTICVGCNSFLRFDSKMGLYVLNRAALEQFPIEVQRQLAEAWIGAQLYKLIRGLSAPPAVIKAAEQLKGTPATTTIIAGTKCPKCSAPITAQTSFTGHTPSPGDLTLCMECSTLMRFDPNMCLEAVTDEEFAALPPEHRNVIEHGRREMELAKQLYLNKTLATMGRVQTGQA